MEILKITKARKPLKGEIKIPGDKSISHRALMLGAIAEGKTIIHGLLRAEDCIRTAIAFKLMGIEIEGIEDSDKPVIVHGKGLTGLKESWQVIDCGNSGTTMRLILGILAGQRFFTVLCGDYSLSQRPMRRVVEPLRFMGANIWGRDNGSYPPLAIFGAKLKPIDYILPVASAQVKSCLLLAGLYADGTTQVTEPAQSRDHTERMLQCFGVELEKENLSVRIRGGQQLKGKELIVPSDISSASFFIVATCLIPDSELIIPSVGVNPTRIGIIEILQKMGANIKLENLREINNEPVADIYVKTSQLNATEVKGEIIPKLIDEIPILAVAATQATGTTLIKDAKELRVKETDRIRALATELTRMGAKVEELEDGLIIHGITPLKGAKVQSYNDHRIAMSLAIAGLIAEGTTEIEGAEYIATSFPSFPQLIEQLV